MDGGGAALFFGSLLAEGNPTATFTAFWRDYRFFEKSGTIEDMASAILPGSAALRGR